MMAAQSVLIAETIAGMKKAISRRESSSDSDVSIHQLTNRGNKLKRSARYIQEGQLDTANGPRVYRRKIEHAGYQRFILNRNPRRFDEDGDELEQDDVDEGADAAAAEENPYSGIKLETLLAPLTSASDLPNHPSLSIPYISKTLSQMTQQACEMVQREKASLCRMKQLLTKFRGDEMWAPCGHYQTENDVNLFGPIQTATTDQSVSVHGAHVEEPLPVKQDNIGVSTVQDNTSVFHAAGPRERDVPPRYSSPPLTALAAIADERQLPGEIERLRARQQCPDPVQAALNALIGGGADKDMSGAQDDTSAHLQGKVGEGELSAAEHSHVTGGISKNDIMDGSPNAQKVMREDKDAPTAPPVSSDSVEYSEQNPPLEVSDVTADAGKAGPVSNSNDEWKSAEPVPSTSDVAGGNMQSAEPSMEPAGVGNGSADNPPKTTDPEHPKEPQAEGREREEDEEILQPAQHRMRTRAQAQAVSDNATNVPTRSPSPTLSTSTFVHPFFLAPISAHPDRDFGLPPAEAEDTRRVLMSYVQKQEEVCRGVEKLYEGLLRADRMRKRVLQWCKAEEHVGEMSDGEDWYDKEEWALDEDLKKGHDEEEDEGGNQGKKTRGRRA